MAAEADAKQQQTLEFQAEVKQLLNIVINSLYTDREIFLRELVSNAADALEKLRYRTITDKEVADPDLPLEITIEVNEQDKTLTISDTGIGMTRDELVENLGTIARSGSRAFLQQLAEAEQKDLNLIGQFGVGFYSAFMVARRVQVLTRSFVPGEEGCQWVSDGVGSYTIDQTRGLSRGTKIILELKDDAGEFASPDAIKRIIKRYSNFVPFPIIMGGEKINTVQAIWVRNKNEIKDEEYTEFYKFIANAYDEPFYRLHFTADAPLAINALLFVPQENLERFGFGKIEPGVSLYCRKVMLQQNAEGLLPEWLRFVKGVVDSEDIPINISRETMQDSALVARLRKVLTGRFLKFLGEQAKADPDKYSEFWKKFGIFLKEGAASDYAYSKDIAPLLRFESSKSEPGKYISLDDYLARMPEKQKHLYYINGPTREIIEAGPYLEAFKVRDLEVIYTHEPVDDFVLTNLAEYKDKKLVSADQAELDLPEVEEDKDAGADAARVEGLDLKNLLAFMKQALGDRVSEVRESKRLVDSPAVLINMDDGMTSSMQRVMQALHKDIGGIGIGQKALEINPGHKLIKGLESLRQKDADFATLAVEQIYDNALIASGLLTDPRDMVDRMYRILERALAE
ncbi:molecular chaperone HtpG [Desulfoscipio gibsoniae]|uniref:Chaperone protein HtpG n=1 Tax=Desulfoscipio gibsoniae DSM 7213 TaxID=767817 RepID=R4KJ22_9FIRM|nr:molecular chaperone HtpG [Desulfoscipio gibsoniae]AGL00500.1 molecular chaperone of HSP90 family [Desulfoscipio gibsoniae DSM 7213]